MLKLFHIYITAIMLFSISTKRENLYLKKRYSFQKGALSSIIKKRLKDIYQKDTKSYSIHYSYLTGKKNSLKSKIKRDHEKLALQHLLTPSGLHLSVAYNCLAPLKKNIFLKKIYNFLPFLFVIFINFIEQYFSLKRMGLFKLLKKIDSSFNLRINGEKIFIITFVFDFLFGSFSESPLSFCFSFIFLGSILFSKNKLIPKLLSLYGAYIISSYFIGDKIHLLTPILGFLITFIFTLIFPSMIVLIFIPSFISKPILSFVISHFYKFISYCAQLIDDASFFYPQYFLLPLIIYFFSSDKKNSCLLILCLIPNGIMYSQSNKKIYSFNNKKIISLPAQNDLLSSKYTKKGIEQKYKRNIYCTIYINSGLSFYRCKKKK